MQGVGGGGGGGWGGGLIMTNMKINISKCIKADI